MKRVYNLMFMAVIAVLCCFGISNVDASCSTSYVGGSPKIEFDVSDDLSLGPIYEKGTSENVSLCVYNIPVSAVDDINFTIDNNSIAKVTNLGKRGEAKINGELAFYTVIAKVDFLAAGKPKLAANLIYNNESYKDTLSFNVLDSFYTFGIAKEGLSSSIETGETVHLTSSITDHTWVTDQTTDATSKTTWTSSDESILKVDGGLVKALRGGQATITAEYSAYDRNFKDTYSLNVTDNHLYNIISTGNVTSIGDSSVKFGTIVKLKITPQNYYKLKNIIIKNARTNEDVTEEVKYNSSSKEFVMPSYDVKLDGIFVSDYKESISSLKASLASYFSVNLSWTNAKDAVGYQLCYKKSSSKNYICNYNASLKNVKLDQGTKYDFKVTPFILNNDNTLSNNKYMLSTNSKTVSIYTLKKMNKPKVTKKSKKKVKVTINKINGATGYEIATSKKKSTNYKIVKTITSNKNVITIKAKKGKKTYYKVRAYKIENGKKIYAPWSNAKKYILK